MLNRLLCFFAVFVVLLPYFGVGGRSVDISISADSAIVMIADTRQVIYEHNAHEKKGIASTTKIMSSIIALESGKTHLTTTVRYSDIAVEGTSLGLKAGDEVSLLTLVKGMLLSSGNDAANVTATFVAGGKEPFARLMNEKAKSIGMNSTNFVNPSGLTEDEHYSTAYDMALLGSYAIKNPVFSSISSMKNCSISYGERGSATLYNHNKFLNRFEGAFGIKTGFTKASGRCLVTAAERDGVTLICVTLDAPDDWHDHEKLMEYAFSEIQTCKHKISTPQIAVTGSDKTHILTEASREIVVPYVGDIPQITTTVNVSRFLYAGVKKGDVVGDIQVTCNGKEMNRIPLISKENADVKPITQSDKPIDKLKEFLRKGLSQRQT